MAIYGVALLAACTLIGAILGDLLGYAIGVKANVGGVGIARGAPPTIRSACEEVAQTLGYSVQSTHDRHKARTLLCQPAPRS